MHSGNYCDVSAFRLRAVFEHIKHMSYKRKQFTNANGNKWDAYIGCYIEDIVPSINYMK